MSTRLHTNVERIAARLIAKERNIYKGVSADVDFTADLFKMLGLPQELYTPAFCNRHVAGWSAHPVWKNL